MITFTLTPHKEPSVPKNTGTTPPPKTQTAAIIEFLAASPDSSFSPGEVADPIGTDRTRATYALADLARRGKILRASPGRYQALPASSPTKTVSRTAAKNSAVKKTAAKKPAAKRAPSKKSSAGNTSPETITAVSSKRPAPAKKRSPRTAARKIETAPTSRTTATPALEHFRTLADGRILLTDPNGDIWEASKLT
jgi:hypothetical protein